MNDPTPREQLPWRRYGVRQALVCRLAGSDFQFTGEFNFYADGRLGELFARPFKTGADLENLLDKFCIAVSRLLQHGETIDSFAHCIDDGTPAGARDIFHALIAGGVEAEKQMKHELSAAAGAGHQ